MKPERWQQIDPLLQSTLELEPGQRASFLAEACSGDASLLQEVESLLAFHERGRDFMESPPSSLAAKLLSRLTPNSLEKGKIGHYEILEAIGAGGMGVVYRARDSKLGRDVAIKVLPAGLSSDRQWLPRFEQEARSAAALCHPNIVTIHEIVHTESGCFIVMELVNDKTLREILTSGPVPARKLLDLAVQIAQGLAHAHAAGIIHRDLKPENIMLTKGGVVKILDFGLALAAPKGQGKEGTNGARSAHETDFRAIAGTAG